MAKKASPAGSKPGGKARSAKTGRYVTRDYAKKHPSTTVTEGKPGGSKPGSKKGK